MSMATTLAFLRAGEEPVPDGPAYFIVNDSNKRVPRQLIELPGMEEKFQASFHNIFEFG